MTELLTTMTAEDLLIYNRCYWQTVETVGKCFPQLYVVSPLACDRSPQLLLLFLLLLLLILQLSKKKAPLPLQSTLSLKLTLQTYS